MSTTLEAFVVDPDRLQRTFGSNDAQLVLGIAQHFEREIQNLESEAAGMIAKGAPTVKEALDEITAGKITRPDFSEMYRHAFVFLIRHIGKALPRDQFESARWSYIEELQWIQPILDAGIPLPIPQSSQDSDVGHLTANQAQERYESLRDTDFSDLDPEIASGREQILEWFEEAARRKWGIVIVVS